MITIKNLEKSFGKKTVLNGINLSFDVGRVYGIVGHNGAGKTTLFRCLAGLEPYEGTISSAFNPLKNKLGLLLTEPFYFSKITGKEYIELLLAARKQDISKISEKNVFDLPLNKYASTYSTGMKKKLALTAILLQENEVFILDEPFNGVDVEGNFLITEIIKKLKSAGKTILISSHIFTTLKDTCDEIHLLEGGEITKSVLKSQFEELEKQMFDIVVGNKIASLGI